MTFMIFYGYICIFLLFCDFCLSFRNPVLPEPVLYSKLQSRKY